MQKQVLVVEADLELLELLRFNLAKQGFAMRTATDENEALNQVRSLRPDLILLDSMLPELDGFAVCEILRKNPITASIPIIILSAMSSQLSQIAGLDAGANLYVTKPFNLRYLMQRIQDLLSPVAADSGHIASICG
jgi:DNA-binding response OmpR family regulator